MPSTRLLIFSWVCQIAAAAILFQTLFFKFTGVEESRFIFTRLGIEPWGRWASGCAELFAVMLLLHPRTAAIGGLLSMGVIIGAIAGHMTRLGIVVKDDGGLLFGLAIAVLILSTIVVVIRRSHIPIVGERLSEIRLTSCSSGMRHHEDPHEHICG